MTKHFDTLRTSPWDPQFKWVDDVMEAADVINSWHEDYPDRVNRTMTIMLYWSNILPAKYKRQRPTTTETAVEPSLEDTVYPERWSLPISQPFLKSIHIDVFHDEDHKGKWREAEVVVGLHRPPDHTLVFKFMDELTEKTTIYDLDGLKDWYSDFEAIHPFFNGNGRVGGVVLSVYSYLLTGREKWLVPLQ